jgi:hypothetical protein
MIYKSPKYLNVLIKELSNIRRFNYISIHTILQTRMINDVLERTFPITFVICWTSYILERSHIVSRSAVSCSVMEQAIGTNFIYNIVQPIKVSVYWRGHFYRKLLNHKLGARFLHTNIHDP